MRLIENVCDFPFVFDCTRVPELRETHSLSQRALAIELGVSPQQLSRWEGGHASPPVDVCLQIISKYGAAACAVYMAVRTVACGSEPEEIKAIDAACQRKLSDR